MRARAIAETECIHVTFDVAEKNNVKNESSHVAQLKSPINGMQFELDASIRNEN